MNEKGAMINQIEASENRYFHTVFPGSYVKKGLNIFSRDLNPVVNFDDKTGNIRFPR